VIVRVARDFGLVRVDTSDWPVLLLEFPEHRVEDVEFRDAMTHIEHTLLEAKSLGLKSFQVTDLTRMREIAPASQRKHAADWMKRTLPIQRAASVGGANVTPSTILRGLITAIYWFQPPPMPTTFVSTRKEAMLMAVRALEEARLPVPLAVRYKAGLC
jgi:hypothetical protein